MIGGGQASEQMIPRLSEAPRVTNEFQGQARGNAASLARLRSARLGSTRLDGDH